MRLVFNQTKGIEVGVGIEGVGVLGAFEEVDDEIGEGSGNDLVDDFEEIACDDDFGECRDGIGSEEGEGDDERGVDGLADDGGADGAGPEPAAAREELHSGHGIGVGELTGPEGDERGGVAVDLGEDVSEDVGDREEKERAGDGDGADADDLLRDKIGNEKDDDEGRDEDVQVLELAGHLGKCIGAQEITDWK